MTALVLDELVAALQYYADEGAWDRGAYAREALQRFEINTGGEAHLCFCSYGKHGDESFRRTPLGVKPKHQPGF